MIRFGASNGGTGNFLESIGERIQKKIIKRRRKKLSALVAASLSHTVAYGPFQGMKIFPEQFWGYDQGSKCLGLYEAQIIALLKQISDSGRRNIFIDVGGADGYYAIGCLVGGLFLRSIAFEMTSEGRERISRAALLNGVSDRVELHGEADRHTISDVLSGLDMKKCVFLIDIEGAEFNLFTPELLASLADAEIIMELHDFTETREKTKAYLGSIHSHDVKIINETPRDPRSLRELRNLHDNDCWLLMSEGRQNGMDWAHLTPKKCK